MEYLQTDTRTFMEFTHILEGNDVLGKADIEMHIVNRTMISLLYVGLCEKSAQLSALWRSAGDQKGLTV